MTHTRVKVGEHIICINIAGALSASTFVLVHGIGTSMRYFEPLSQALSRQHRVVSLDLPGFGSSSRPRRTLSVSDLARVVNQLITEQAWPRPILVGQSMGCQIVAHMAAEFPRAYPKIALISPTIYDRERTAWHQALRLAQDTLREPLPASATVFRDYLRCGPRRYLSTSRYMLADRIEDQLSDCPAYTLMIRGFRDCIVPHAWAAKLTELTPRSSLAEVDQAPHLVHFTHPNEIAELCAKLAR